MSPTRGRKVKRHRRVSPTVYCEICSTVSPVRTSWPDWAMSAWARMPTSLPSSSQTGSRRTWCSAINRAASSRLCCGSTVTTSFDAISATGVSPPRPSPSTRRARSRSVTTPVSRSFSTIGSEPTSSDFIVRAASWALVVGWIVVGLDVITSWIVWCMSALPSFAFGTGSTRYAAAKTRSELGRVAPLVRARDVLRVARLLLRVWDRRPFQLAAVVLAGMLSILIAHEGALARLVGTRTSGRRHRSRCRPRDRAEARRSGRADPAERDGAGPAAAAPGRHAHSDPDDARHPRSRRAPRTAPLGGSPARRGSAPPLPRGEGRDRAPDRERLLLRLRVPRGDPRGGARADRGGDPARARRGSDLAAGGARRGRGQAPLRVGGRAVQGRARRYRRRPDLPLHPGRLHRSLPRAAPAGLEADQGAQADLARRRLLARRRAQHAADPHLRHRLLLAGRPRRLPRAAGAGEGTGPPPPRNPARPLPLRRALAGVALLAPERDGDLERARGSAPLREREARVPRGEDATHLRKGSLGDVRPLGEVPREHVPDPAGGRPALRDQADELSRPHAPLRQRAAQLPRPPSSLRRGGAAPPERARRRASRADARPARDSGRRAHLLHA